MSKVEMQHHVSNRPADERALVYYPYTWSASDYDTGDRLDMAADMRVVAQDGTTYAFDFITGHMPGTGRIYIDSATRRQLKTPDGAADLAKRYGETLREAAIFGDYDTVIVSGNSGRAPQVARMILGLLNGSESTQPFTHVMTADGFDANAPHSPLFPVIRGGVFLLRHASRKETDFSVPQSPGRPRSLARNLRAVAYKRAESYALGPMYQTTSETTDALRDLARQVIIPYLNIGFEFGISGSNRQVLAFNKELEQIHDEAIAANGGESAPFRAIMEPHGHGDLLNPAVTVGHAAMTLALTDTALEKGFEAW